MKHNLNIFCIVLFLNTSINLAITGQEYIQSIKNEHRTLTTPVELHLTSPTAPLENSTVHLNHTDAWVYFDNMKPSDVLANYKSLILIDEETLNPNVNGRVSIYKHGTVIIPHGAGFNPLEVFTEKGFRGSSTSYPIQSIHNSLGSFDNSIQSIKLKKGYMATFATSPDGMGYSRVFTADKADLNIDLPAKLSNNISFIRVLKHQWVTKKSICSPYTYNAYNNTNSTWYYNWNINGNTTNNFEYVLIRQTEYWPSKEQLIEKTDVSHLLGYNEPNKEDQADMSVERAIKQWPELIKTGLRLGSPCPSNIWGSQGQWLEDFINECDKRNYRVDFVVLHCYWEAKSPQNWYKDLKWAWERYGKRPIWITEWNNGANWTKEWWPDSDRSYTDKNAKKQLNDIKAILQVLDTTSFIERYSIYNKVEDARDIERNNGNLTLAGEYYASNKSALAYNSSNDFIPKWNVVKPDIFLSNNSNSIVINWNDENNEVANQYALEKKSSNGEYETIFTTNDNSITSYSDISPEGISGTVFYRLKVISVDGTEAISNNAVYHITGGNNQIQTADLGIPDLIIQKTNFTTTFTNPPVVILGPISYNNNRLPMTVRADNVGNSTAEFLIKTWRYVEEPVMNTIDNVSILAVPQGNLNIGSLKAESGIIPDAKTDWIEVAFKEPFDTIPVVFACQVTNKASFATTVRTKNISNTGFSVCIQKEESNPFGVWGDDISYFAITPGEDSLDNIKIKVGLSEEADCGGFYQNKEIEFDSLRYPGPSFFANLHSNNDEIVSTLRYTKKNGGSYKVFKKRETSASSNPVQLDKIGYMIIDVIEPTSTVTSITNNAKTNMYKFYPNPAKNVLYFDNNDYLHIQITDITGRIITEGAYYKSVDIHDLPSGLYIININKTEQYKLIKL